MPNHVINKIKIKKLNPAQVDDFVNRYTIVTEDGERIIDFDKIIPEPRLESECPDKYKVNKESHIEISKDRPWFDWFDWHLEYWNTKWNAYDGYVLTDTHSITLVFNTAWSAPTPIYQKLADIGYDIEVKWADEDLGSNCGKSKWIRSEQRWDMTRPEDMRDPRLFAERLWRS